MSRLSRVITTAVAVAAAVLGPTMVATSAPAYADTDSCVDFLADQGIDITDGIVDACSTGENGDFEGCRRGLLNEGVQPPFPRLACQIAQR
jgi:hypothetical protein